MRKVLLLLLMLFFSLSVLAANDPGHDTLYLEQNGSSELDGDLNITEDLRIDELIYSSFIDIIANGTILGAPSQPRIMGGASQMYIDSTGNLYINTLGGTSSIIQIGDTSTNAITLNVSGIIRQQNVQVCLENGSFCPAGAAESGNVSGTGSTNTIAKWVSATEIGNSVITDDGNVTIDTTTLVVDAANNRIGIGTETPDEILTIEDTGGSTGATAPTILINETPTGSWTIGAFFGKIDFANTDGSGPGDGGVKARMGVIVTDALGSDNALSFRVSSGTALTQTMLLQSGRAGIGPYFDGTNLPTTTLHLHSGSTSTYLTIDGGTGEAGIDIISDNDGENARIYVPNNLNDLYIDTPGTIGADMVILTTGEVGINKTSPQNTLEVQGTINASAIQVGTNPVCQQDGTNCPGGLTGSGWLNNSGSGNISMSDPNANVSANTLFVDNTGSRVGIGTATPENLLSLQATGDTIIKFKSTENDRDWVLNVRNITGNFLINNQDNGGNEISISPTGTLAILEQITVSGTGTNTIAGNTTFDSTTLHVDSTNNRIGIGDTTPGEALDVTGNINATGDICITGGNCLSAGGSGSGWLNDSGSGNISMADPNANVSANILFIDNTDGRVGIGTTRPQYPLDVNSTGNTNIRVTSNKTDGNVGVRISNAIQEWRWMTAGTSANTFRLRDVTNGAADPIIIEPTTPTNTLYLNSSGNVGIGTTNPEDPLHILRSDASRTSILVQNSNGVAQNTDIKLNNSASEWAIRNSATGNLYFQETSDGSVEMSLDVNGNLGIGTTSPTAPLTIEANLSHGAAINITNTENVTSGHGINFIRNQQSINGAAIGGINWFAPDNISEETLYAMIYARAQTRANGSENGSLHFRTTTEGTSTDTLVIREGKIGIGTATPDDRLHVESAGNTYLRIESTNDTEELTGIYLLETTAGSPPKGFLIEGNGTGEAMNIRQVNGGTDFNIMTFTHGGTSEGDVGIGTATPAAKLDVNGTIGIKDMLPANNEASGMISTMQVDVNAHGIGACLHLDTDGNWIEASATSIATMPCAALAIESGTGAKKVLLNGFMRHDNWDWTVGDIMYVSTVNGNLTQTAPFGSGNQVQSVGIATHADRVYFNPNYVLVEVS